MAREKTTYVKPRVSTRRDGDWDESLFEAMRTLSVEERLLLNDRNLRTIQLLRDGFGRLESSE